MTSQKERLKKELFRIYFDNDVSGKVRNKVYQLLDTIYQFEPMHLITAWETMFDIVSNSVVLTFYKENRRLIFTVYEERITAQEITSHSVFCQDLRFQEDDTELNSFLEWIIGTTNTEKEKCAFKQIYSFNFHNLVIYNAKEWIDTRDKQLLENHWSSPENRKEILLSIHRDLVTQVLTKTGSCNLRIPPILDNVRAALWHSIEAIHQTKSFDLSKPEVKFEDYSVTISYSHGDKKMQIIVNEDGIDTRICVKKYVHSDIESLCKALNELKVR